MSDHDHTAQQSVGRTTNDQQAEAALRESERRFRELFDRSPLPLWEEDWSGVRAEIEAMRRGGVTDIRVHLRQHPDAVGQCLSRVELLSTNQASLDLFEADSKEQILENLDKLISKESWHIIVDLLAALAGGCERFRGEEYLNTCRGHKRHVIFDFVVMPGYEQSWEYCLVGLTDITERKHLEQQLAELTDAERQRIGRQLHDSLGQEISSIGMMASTLRELLGGDSPHADLLDKLEATADQAKSQLRALTKGILPVAVDAHGLAIALEELADQARSASGVACTFECRDAATLDDNFTATQLFLIAREAVHNAVKHAAPGQIVIRFNEGNGVTLSVEDDGTGLRGNVDQSLGMGLRIMHHRAGLIGATLSIDSPATGGTVLTCSVRQ
jgi:two-component sensor histidine kinase